MSLNDSGAVKSSVTADVPHRLETDPEPLAQGGRTIFRCPDCGAESIRPQFTHREGCPR